MATKNKKPDTLFTAEKAAIYLGYETDTVRRYIYRGLIRATKFGSAIEVSKSECDRFLLERRSPGRPSKK